MASVEEQIEDFISTGNGDFNQLACDLFHFQAELNIPYRHYVTTLLEDPGRIDDWRQIPTLPIFAFKQAAVTTFPVSDSRVIFHSSGTTAAERSAHYFEDTRLYDLSIINGWPSHPSKKTRILAVSPPPSEMPDSSLVHMFETLIDHFGDTDSTFTNQHSDLANRLDIAQQQGVPVWLLGTTLHLHQFMEYCDSVRHCWHFDVSLLAMETGGFKGKAESVPPAMFYRKLATVLGISPNAILSEYSMSEISSQFYTRPGTDSRVFLGPAWVRWRIVHPLTGDPVESGEKGVLEIFDLANVHSAFAIQTEDLAHQQDGGFVLDGRVPQAVAKGCSLTA